MSFLLAITLNLFFSTASAQPTGPLSLACSTEKRILVVRLGGQDIRTYQIAVGKKAKPTPMGTYSIRHIVWNPPGIRPMRSGRRGRSPPLPAIRRTR